MVRITDEEAARIRKLVEKLRASTAKAKPACVEMELDVYEAIRANAEKREVANG